MVSCSSCMEVQVNVPFCFSSRGLMLLRFAVCLRHNTESARNNTHAASPKGVTIGFVESMAIAMCVQ
jgi:hypothetical protein